MENTEIDVVSVTPENSPKRRAVFPTPDWCKTSDELETSVKFEDSDKLSSEELLLYTIAEILDPSNPYSKHIPTTDSKIIQDSILKVTETKFKLGSIRHYFVSKREQRHRSRVL